MIKEFMAAYNVHEEERQAQTPEKPDDVNLKPAKRPYRKRLIKGTEQEKTVEEVVVKRKRGRPSKVELAERARRQMMLEKQ